MHTPEKSNGSTVPLSDEDRQKRGRLSGWLSRSAWFLFGVIFFLLAVVGVVLPGIPTTPFLLLTSYCFVRSSPALNRRLLRSTLFGPLLRDWHERGGVRKDVKRLAYASIAGVSLVYVLAVSDSIAQTGVFFSLVALGVIVVARLPEIDPHCETSPQKSCEL